MISTIRPSMIPGGLIFPIDLAALGNKFWHDGNFQQLVDADISTAPADAGKQAVN
jgi:hypothetical protein